MITAEQKTEEREPQHTPANNGFTEAISFEKVYKGPSWLKIAILKGLANLEEFLEGK